MVTLAKLLLSALWIAASAFLATTSSAQHHTLRIIATTVLGLPGAAAFVLNFTDLLGRPLGQTRRRVRRSLQAALVQISRDRLLGEEDVTTVSFHVWLVPSWYRRLCPYRFRRRITPNSHKVPPCFRPTLRRYAMFRFQEHQASGIKFRKGIGIIGRCIDENQPGSVLVAELDGKAFKAALKTEEGWNKASYQLTNSLPYRDAKQLAQSYGQVAAMVIREKSGEAIGCVTLDLPPECNIRLPKPRRPNSAASAKRHPLFKTLQSTTDQVANHLTRR